MKSAIRIAAVVVGAVILVGLGVMLLSRPPQLPEDNAAEPDAPTAAQEEAPKPVDASVERAAPSAESEENGESPERHTTGESFQFSADRWIEILRNQFSPGRLRSKNMIERLEKLRKALERLPPEERYAYVKSENFYSLWEWNPNRSDLENRVRKAIFEESGTYHTVGKTPRSVIEILVEGMDDLTAARNLDDPPWEWNWYREREYALEYVDRALEKDPTSREALLFKRNIVGEYAAKEAVAFQLIEHHPNDEEALVDASLSLRYHYPEATVLAATAYLDQAKGDSNKYLHANLGIAYERLGMLEEAMEQYQIAFAAGDEVSGGRYERVKRGEPYPSIWEERGPDAAAEQTSPAPSAPSHGHPHAVAPDDPHGAPPPHPHDHPDAPRPEGAPPPPSPGEELDMAAAYADFAKAYQAMFEMEYGLSEATPEGYMSALLEMARAFARAGDAQHAQDAYNAVRKRHSREEVEQVFRKLDERERLKRQPPSEDEEDDGEDE